MKRLARNLLFGIAAGIMCIGSGDACRDIVDNGGHAQAFSDQKLLRANASELKSTLVVPHQDVPMARGRNLLWCGTFQLAWNEVCQLIGGSVEFVGPPSPDATSLNKRSFDKSAIDAGSYVSVAGYVQDDVYRQIERELRETFGGMAHSVMPPRRSITDRPQDIVAYSYLFKQLLFAVPFERGQAPVPFEKVKVECFGMGPEYKPGREAMAAQTVIHDYMGPDDFVIELMTRSKGDRILLAKTKPAETLAATISQVRQRAEKPGTPASVSDVLVIPKLNFDLTREYAELLGRRLRPVAEGVAENLQLSTATQNIRYQMDEAGVRLRSESTMRFGCSASGMRPEHLMVFDKPFLIMLQREAAAMPYFALWVENGELLVHAE
jgi:hypothetical protein